MSFGKDLAHHISENPIGPQERIAYKGELKPFLDLTLSHYSLGEYTGHEVKMNGYEDFNLVLYTTQQTVFVKCFADWRSPEECQRYLEMIEAAKTKGGVQTPTLFNNCQGTSLTSVNINDKTVYLSAMQFLDNGNIWESKQPLNTDEQAEVIRQAAKINSCAYKPAYSRDSWAIINAVKTYSQNYDRIDPGDRVIIEELLEQLKQVDISALPHSFVHGDIRTTNVMRHSDGQIYIIDFSVANWYPRIMEFAVLCSDILFNPENLDEFNEKYYWAINQYTREGISLSPLEQSLLPLFVRLGHAMNVIGSNSVTATNYISQAENEHWLRLGRKGLHFAVKDWKP